MNRPIPDYEVRAVYVVCVRAACACHGDGSAHGPFWRIWYSDDRLRSRYVHRADARRVAQLCGRGPQRLPMPST